MSRLTQASPNRLDPSRPLAPAPSAAECEQLGALAVSSRSDRVDFIERLMTSCEWRPTTQTALAKLWGLQPVTVRLMASEASHRILRAYKEAPEEVVARLAAGLDHVVKVALEKQRHTGCNRCGTVTSHADPDCSSAVKAQVALAQILGLAPGRDELQVKYEALDDSKLLSSILRAAAAQPHLRPLLLEALEEMKLAELELTAAAKPSSLVQPGMLPANAAIVPALEGSSAAPGQLAELPVGGGGDAPRGEGSGLGPPSTPKENQE